MTNPESLASVAANMLATELRQDGSRYCFAVVVLDRATGESGVVSDLAGAELESAIEHALAQVRDGSASYSQLPIADPGN